MGEYSEYSQYSEGFSAKELRKVRPMCCVHGSCLAYDGCCLVHGSCLEYSSCLPHVRDNRCAQVTYGGFGAA